MRYFITFYHFTTLAGYSTGTLLSSNTKGNFADVNFILSHLQEKYEDKRTTDITIQETVEITDTEFNRLNKILNKKI